MKAHQRQRTRTFDLQPPVCGLVLLTALIAASTVAAASLPLDNDISLGRALFEDKNLSVDRSVACASCHVAEHAFADTRSISIGVGGKTGTRNAPSLLSLRDHPSFFWDGRAATLEDQAHFPFFNAVEMGMANEHAVLDRVRENQNYVYAFERLSGVSAAQLTMMDVIHALTAYERSLPDPVTPLDRYLTGDTSALSSDAQAGLKLFNRAGCTSCHSINDSSAPLTDHAFHDSSVALSAVGSTLGTTAVAVSKLTEPDRFARVGTDPQTAALGRFVVTLNPKDIGTFMTPSLRNVALTAPYMHDGSVATLDEAIDREIYYHGLKDGYPSALSLPERHQLRAFLESASEAPPASIALGAQPTSAIRRHPTLHIDHGIREHHGITSTTHLEITGHHCAVAMHGKCCFNGDGSGRELGLADRAHPDS